MSDIGIIRLREILESAESDHVVCEQAADEIERLSIVTEGQLAEIERVRERIERWEAGCHTAMKILGARDHETLLDVASRVSKLVTELRQRIEELSEELSEKKQRLSLLERFIQKLTPSTVEDFMDCYVVISGRQIQKAVEFVSMGDHGPEHCQVCGDTVLGIFEIERKEGGGWKLKEEQ